MSDSQSEITPDQIAAAETLLALDFTPAQRQQMLEIVNGRRGQYQSIRAADLDNSVPLALNFNVNASDPAPAAVPRTCRMSAQPPAQRPANLEDAAFYPVTRLAELIRTRQVSSLELTEMYLRRLKRCDPALQCVAAYTEERAYAQATRADDEIARGLYRGPLHGIPWGAKDLLATRGYPTQWGAKPYEGQTLDADATVVQRLEDAGAVLIAKLTLGALANGDVWYGGMTPESLGYERGQQRLFSRLGRGSGGWLGRLRHRHRDHGQHRLAIDPLRRLRLAAHLRPRQPQRRHGTLLEPGQDRAHVPLGRGLRPRFQRHLRSRRRGHDDQPRAISMGSGARSKEPAHRLPGQRL